MTYRGMFFMYRGILFFLIVSLSAACQSKKSEDKEMPNILFLLADDLGYGELGVYGQGVIKTPVLDELAENAMRFTNFYAGNSVCSPSRAVLMTGVGSSHNTIRGNEGWFENVGNFDRVALKTVM